MLILIALFLIFQGEQEAPADPTETATLPPKAEGLTAFARRNRRNSIIAEQPEPPAPAEFSSNAPENLEETNAPKESEIAMNLDETVTNYENMENSQEDAANDPEVIDNTANLVDNTNANIYGDPIQELSKVPESISEEGQEYVHDDLTETSYKETMDIAMEEQGGNAKPAVSNDEASGRDINDMSVGPKATEAPVAMEEDSNQQTAVKTTNAARVSMSPTQTNTTNRGGDFSFVENRMPNSTSNNDEMTSTGMSNQTDMTSGAMANSINIGPNENQKYESINAQSNENTMDTNMDDDNSIVIPGVEPIPLDRAPFTHHPKSINEAKFGTEFNTTGFADGLDTYMDLNTPVDNGKDSYGMDVSMSGVEKKDAAIKSNDNMAASVPTRTARNFPVIQNPGHKNKPPLVDRTASSRIGALGNNLKNRFNKSRFNSTSQKTKVSNAVSYKDNNRATVVTTKVAAAHNSTTVTPPGRGRNVSGTTTTPFAHPGNNDKHANASVTPDATTQNFALPSVPMAARETEKLPLEQVARSNNTTHFTPPPSITNTSTTPKMSNVRGLPTRPSVLMPTREAQKQPAAGVPKNPVASNGTSFGPPASTNVDNDLAPKMSNSQAQSVANQSKDTQWSLSITEPSCSNYSFDELLHQFLQDIQEAADLHDQGENELLDLEVDLSHAMAAALRYKGDMMNLLDDIEGTKASAERVLSHFSE